MDGEMNNAPTGDTIPQGSPANVTPPVLVPKSPESGWWGTLITILVIIIILALVGGGYYYFFFRDGSQVARNEGENEATLPPPGAEITPPPAPKALEGTAPPSKSVTNTDDWLRYQNSQYGFEIKYPPEWAAEANLGEASKFVYLSPTSAVAGGVKPAVVIELYPNQPTLAAVLKNFDYLKGEYRDITVDGLPAKEITATDQNAREVIVVVFAKGSVGYSLTAGGFGGTGAVFETSKKILSTFAFLD